MTFKNAKLSRDELIHINSPLNTGSLLAVRWCDKRDVFVLSTIHGTGSVHRRGDDTPFPNLPWLMNIIIIWVVLIIRSTDLHRYTHLLKNQRRGGKNSKFQLSTRVSCTWSFIQVLQVIIADTQILSTFFHTWNGSAIPRYKSKSGD